MLKILKKKETWFLLFLGVISSITMFHHEMWFDEAQALVLARDSDGIVNLWKNLRYEGHPALWHLCSQIALKIWTHPFSVQILHLILGLSTIAIVLFKSPFSFIERILISSSYFLFYEYLIISRNYAIGILLLFLAVYIWVNSRSKWRFLLASVLLALACNSSFHALLVSSGLFGSFLISQLYVFTKERQGMFISLVLPILIISAAVLLVYLGLRPFPDRALDYKVFTDLSLPKLLHVVRDIGEALFNVPTYHWNMPWNWKLNCLAETSLAQGGCDLPLLLMQKLFYATPAIFISVLLLSLLWLVRKTRTPLIFLILSIGALWLFKYAMREGGIRHDGFTFITIVLVYWLWHQYRTRSSRLDLKIFRSVFILMLIFQAVSSISYHILDNKYVFADGKGVARFIENHQLQSKKILFSPQWGAPPVLWHSQIRDGYFVETQKNQSFVVYSKQAKKQLSQSEVLAAAQQENSQLLIFLDKWETLQPNDTAFLNAGYQLVYLTPNQKILTPMEERYRVYLKQEENQE